ncbi:phage tail assembly protein [Caballeronia zhejiangensis]|uniref:phage tail assembly protein n=1 Tax=Caballeronia zhejiangensis TaxID=871203 RepID=UPI00158F426F|nr:phage tail assembly protein [Caballeronia zhejiangensis]
MADEKKKRKEVPDSLTIELKNAITLGGGGDDSVYTEIVLQEPNLEQLSTFIKKANKDGALDAMKYLISSVSGVPLPVLSKIGVRDFYKAQDYLTEFISPPDEDDPEGNVAGSQ